MSQEHTPTAARRIHPFTFAGLVQLMLDELPASAAAAGANSDRLARTLAAQAEYIRKSLACLRTMHAEIVAHGSPTVATMEQAAGLLELADLPIPQALAAQEAA